MEPIILSCKTFIDYETINGSSLYQSHWRSCTFYHVCQEITLNWSTQSLFYQPGELDYLRQLSALIIEEVREFIQDRGQRISMTWTNTHIKFLSSSKLVILFLLQTFRENVMFAASVQSCKIINCLVNFDISLIINLLYVSMSPFF